MKIRKGFVSNSSSSSFHIYGAELDSYDFKQFLIKMSVATEEEIDEDGLAEFVDLLDTDLQIYHWYDAERVYIGRTYSSIEDGETGAEFKADAIAKIAKLFGEEKECGQHFETYYN